jgi:hypothetical protein
MLIFIYAYKFASAQTAYLDGRGHRYADVERCMTRASNTRAITNNTKDEFVIARVFDA